MRIVQVLDALDYGDGVSNDVINKHNIFLEMGFEAEIYSKWSNEKVNNFRKEITKLKVDKNDILLHHFSGKSNILDEVMKAKCKKYLVYHNITPESYLKSDINGESYNEGIKQIEKMHINYSGFLADSEYNAECLRNIGITRDIDILPIAINFSNIDTYLKKHTKSQKMEKIFLFVGRVAPNKKHEDIIDIFDYYYKNIDSNCKLIFVGNYVDYMDYYIKLQEKLKLLCLSNTVVFTGKVDEKQLYQNYLDADIFICMSEHEGFCIPLLESMYCGLPTLAYDAGAIKTTMGDSGVIISYKNKERIAKLIYIILNNKRINKQIIDKQNKWVRQFAKEEIKLQIKDLIKKWSEE